MEEEQLVLTFQNGNKETFDLLYEKYKDQAMRSMYLVTNNPYDCEDIVQEAFIKCYQNISQLKDVCQFKSWFYQILYRTARSDANVQAILFPGTCYKGRGEGAY